MRAEHWTQQRVEYCAQNVANPDCAPSPRVLVLVFLSIGTVGVLGAGLGCHVESPQVLEAPPCKSQELLCGDICRDVLNDSLNCGECGAVCEGLGRCVTGLCVVPCRGILCGSECVTDTDRHQLHCGGCYQACRSNEACVEGRCAPTCPVGEDICGETCVDFARDTSNCGACGRTCSSLETCSGGTCVDQDKDSCSNTAIDNLVIDEIALYQAVKISLAQREGDVLVEHVPQANRARPVADRYALLRVFVRPLPRWKPRELVAQLEIQEPGSGIIQSFSSRKYIEAASEDGDADSTFQFELSRELMVPGVSYRVSLIECQNTQAPDLSNQPNQYPADGFAPLNLSVTGPLRVHLVPIRSSAGLPEITEEAIDVYRQRIMAVFPVSDVVITLGEPLEGADSMCGHLGPLRVRRGEDDAPSDVYYYGLTRGPDNNVTGCSSRSSNPASSVARVSVGWDRSRTQGFERGAATMCHELGHAHGRLHAPCGGPSSPDPSYPFPEADIGAWGYDVRDHSFKHPDQVKDMMSYCPNPDRTDAWVSTYTYDALVDRVQAVSPVTLTIDRPLQVEWRLLMVINGEPYWNQQPVLIRGTPPGRPIEAVYEHSVTRRSEERGKLRGRVTVYEENLVDGLGVNLMVTVPAHLQDGVMIHIPGLPVLVY